MRVGAERYSNLTVKSRCRTCDAPGRNDQGPSNSNAALTREQYEAMFGQVRCDTVASLLEHARASLLEHRLTTGSSPWRSRSGARGATT